MHIVGPDVNSDELASFTVRTDVQAIPCPEGATVTDKDGNQLASYADKCYVVVDGDKRLIVSAYVFDGLYTETSEPKATVTTSEDIAAAHAQATPAATAATGGTFDAEAKAVLSDLTPEQRAELRAALADLDPATETAPADTSTGTTSTPAETATTATPSVAALSAPDGGDGSGTTTPATPSGQ